MQHVRLTIMSLGRPRPAEATYMCGKVGLELLSRRAHLSGDNESSMRPFAIRCYARRMVLTEPRSPVCPHQRRTFSGTPHIGQVPEKLLKLFIF
jgi:hypothetical protein